MSQFHAFSGWEPIIWEPVIHAGSDFVWSATTSEPHHIDEARVVFGGSSFDAEVSEKTLAVRAPAPQLIGLETGDPAALYIKTAGRTIIWLKGYLVMDRGNHGS